MDIILDNYDWSAWAKRLQAADEEYNMTRFQSRCLEVAEQVGVEVHFYDETVAKADAFHDDGTLHVQKSKMRACFDVSNSQNLSGRKQNKNTEAVMQALGLEVTSRVLVDDFDEEDNEDDSW